MKQWPWKYILVSLTIGLLVGAAGGLLIAKCLAHQRKGPGGPQMLVKRFDRELKLTPEQRTQILSILKTAREKMQGNRQQARAAIRTEIRAVLNPEQQKRFDALEARRDSGRMKRWKH